MLYDGKIAMLYRHMRTVYVERLDEDIIWAIDVTRTAML
jgi:hypothetical protein